MSSSRQEGLAAGEGDGVSLGGEIRDFARMHVDLARSEVRFGSARIVRGLVVLIVAAILAVLVLASLGVALFLALIPRFSSLTASLLVAAAYGVLAGICIGLARMWLRDGSSLLLPRTRQMLRELFSWPANPTDS
jgi:uncharacterized membrane protein YqjE